MLKRLKPELVAAAVAAIILTYVLMVRPIIGVADNGDFPRIMNSTGLSYVAESFEDKYFGYVNREFKVGMPIIFGGGYFSTELLPVSFAVLLSQAASASGIFDIRYLSFIYSIVFIAAVFLIIAGIRRRWGIVSWLSAALLIFIFADTSYIAYFNTLYGEAVTLSFLLLMVGAGLYLAFSEKPRLWALLLFFIGAMFFAGAKIQNSPAGVLAVLLGFRLIKLRKDVLWKRTVVFSMAAVVVVSALSYILVSSEIKVCNKYQTVFYGILKDSPNPAKDLEELGLNADLSVLAGTNYFMNDYPVDIRTAEFKRYINENVNHLKIALFYIKKPERIISKLEAAAANGFKLNQGFGNYEKYKGIAYKTITRFNTFWSDFKLKLLPHSLLFVIIFFALSGFIIVFEYLRQKETQNLMALELSGVIWLTGVMQFIMPVIGDGEADLSKHLFLFNVCFDLMFLAFASYCLFRLSNLAKAAFRSMLKQSSTEH